MTSLTDPRIGTELAGYQIEAVLGRGGMSVVYLAEDSSLGRRVALKVLDPVLAEDERFRERFLRESRLAASLDHPNVVPIHETDEADGLLYIAMRHVDGADLGTVLSREGALEQRRALGVIGQVAAALDAAHARGLIHRDVKPGNVLLGYGDGDAEHAYLSDFGLTKDLAAEGLTITRELVGTAHYVAPEIIQRLPIDRRADVYSLGCVLFECLTGAPPFQSNFLMAVLWAHVNDRPPSAGERRPDLPAGIDRVLSRALAKAPEDRYLSCRALADAARAELEPGKSAARALPTRGARRPRAIALAGVLVALALVLALTLRGGESPGPRLAVRAASVQLIDPASGTVRAVVPLAEEGRLSDLRVAAGPEGVWAVDAAAGRAISVDPDGGRIAASLELDADPAQVAVGLGSIWVSGRSPDETFVDRGRLFQIDPERVAVARTIAVDYRDRRRDTPFDVPLRLSEALGAIAVHESERSVWVTNPDGFSLKQVGLPGESQRATVETEGRVATAVATGAGGVWVAQAGRILRVDPERADVIGSVPLRFGAFDVAAGEGAVWVPNELRNTLLRIDPETLAITDSIDVGDDPVAVAAGAGAIWVANRRDETVSKLDPRSLRVETIGVGGRPVDVAVGPTGVWVAVEPAPGESELVAGRYGAVVRDIAIRVGEKVPHLIQPFFEAAVAGGLEQAIEIDPEMGSRQTIHVYEDVIADLELLTPPERFAEDQETLVALLRELVSQFRLNLAAIERGDVQALEAGLARNDVIFRRFDLELSPEFRQFVPIGF